MEAILLTGGVGQPRVTGLARGEDWRSAAACQATDPDLFFPVSGSGKSLEQVERAKAICAACPVRQDCLAFALRIGQADGIWGGLTEEERRKPAVAGAGERKTLGLVARYGDIWNALLPDAETYERKSRLLDEHCARIGRDPGTIERSVLVAEIGRAHV